MSILRIILLLFSALFRDRSQLALENLALRRQLAFLKWSAQFQIARAGPRSGPIRLHDSVPADRPGTPLRGGRNFGERHPARRERNRSPRSTVPVGRAYIQVPC